jgi:hypothetical protein
MAHLPIALTISRCLSRPRTFYENIQRTKIDKCLSNGIVIRNIKTSTENM